MSVYFTIRCDTLPGKEQELDRFLTKSEKFWLDQPGVKGFHVYGDALIGWPERTIMIEVEDMSLLERVLESDERRKLRTEFMTLTTDVQSQILDKLI